jgi:hypothetical protein
MHATAGGQVKKNEAPNLTQGLASSLQIASQARQVGGRANYSAAATAVNVAVSFVPTLVTAVMITTAMRAAISPYSMAVTPELSFKKRRKSLFILIPPVGSDLLIYPLKSYTRADLSARLIDWNNSVVLLRYSLKSYTNLIRGQTFLPG